MAQPKFQDLNPLFSPKSIAVVGASEKPGVGSLAIKNIKGGGFNGPVYAVHPHYSEVYGYPCFPSLSDIPEPPDCVIVAIRNTLVPGIISEAINCGCKSAVVYAGGFAEAGEDGHALQAELKRIADKANFPICGPNCVGFLNLNNGLIAFSARMPEELPPGDVGAVVQSGSLSIGLLHGSRGLRYSHIISAGNEAVTESADYFRHLILDPKTKVVMGFIEGFRSIEKLIEVSRLAREYQKPLVILKIGRSETGRKAAATHTGALAGSDKLHDAFFEKHGIIRVYDFEELLETALLLTHKPLPAGTGVGALTLSGGKVGLLADLGEEEGIHYPSFSKETEDKLSRVLPTFRTITNPLDTWGMGSSADDTPICMDIVAQDPAIDLISVHMSTPNGISKALSESYAHIAKSTVEVAQKHHKPVVFINTMPIGFDPGIQSILSAGDVPLLLGSRTGLQAIRNTIRYSSFLREAPSDESSRKMEIKLGVQALLEKPVLTESESKLVLKAYGIPVTREKVVVSPKDAVLSAREIGYPIAVKIDSPDILHKTEARSIQLNITNDDEIVKAFDVVMKNAKSYKPTARINGVLIQEMISHHDALEMIAGISYDNQFGYSIMVGMGGIFVEVYKDVTLGLVPLNENLAKRMIEKLAGKAILFGARGKPRLDVDAIIDVLLKLSLMAESQDGKINSVDINPLIVLPEGQGVVAADALIVQKA